MDYIRIQPDRRGHLFWACKRVAANSRCPLRFGCFWIVGEVDIVSMRPEDRAYLWDMREAVTEIAGVVTTIEAREFEEARLVRFGVERLVIILGEAAACVSEECRLEHRSIPWRQIQRLRNTMAHTYGKGTALELYRTAREFLAGLVDPR